MEKPYLELREQKTVKGGDAGTLEKNSSRLKT
jgi:hypothetical protein